MHEAEPLNAEPPLDRLRQSFLTPASRFYVRTHGSIPRLEAAAHRLRVDGRVARPLDLTLPELEQRFARHEVTACLQCAGNRRHELEAAGPVSGTPWGAGVIGTARWSGFRLGDVLEAAGAGMNRDELHVAFASCDAIVQDSERFAFGASIPLAKALAPEVLLADRMNDAPLRPEHGFPLRVVVPGHVGARSVKWLAGITLQDAPSTNHFQHYDYKLFPPAMTAETVDWEKGMMLYDLPVNAAICEPLGGVRLAPGQVPVRGYAIAGGRRVERVDVSADGGASWVQARLERGGLWAWTFWEACLDLPPGRHELAVRAVDDAAQTQPEAPRDTWNFKGYANNAWHRVKIEVG